jgi:hypothetical protein
MKFRVQKEVRKTVDQNTGEVVEVEPLLWIVEEGSNKKIALLCVGCDKYANLLAAAPDLLAHVEATTKLHGTDEKPFQLFDDGVKLLMKAQGE